MIMKKVSEWVGKMKKDKIVLCLLAGVLLMVIAIPVGEDKESTVSTKGGLLKEEDSIAGETISVNASLLESQLEVMLSQIEGIGQVEAMITLEPFIDDQEAPEIRGVLVVSEHGDDPIQILKIQETVMTLFQIDAHKIKVMKLK